MLKYDRTRRQRIGLSEAVYCRDKPIDAIRVLIDELSAGNEKLPVLFTRLDGDAYVSLGKDYVEKLDYHAISNTAFLNGVNNTATTKQVAIVTAGTSDTVVAWEAKRTLEHYGVSSSLIEDVGVAGLWRLEMEVKDLPQYDVFIVVAGMDAALCSVVGGLTGKPVIGVPTSAGYGVADGGRTALNSMLTSCSSGISVVNIDNGYGAACTAIRILQCDQNDQQ